VLVVGQVREEGLCRASPSPVIRAQIERVAERHRAELAVGRGEVDLSHALRLELPGASASLAWQYVFPASRPCTDPSSTAARSAS